MPVNIWATVLHLSDGHFSGATDPHRPSLDLLVATKMRKITGNAQVWMINPIWHTPGLTGVLLRESYREMQNASESYLVLITPGFADVTHSIPTDLVQTQLREICRRSRAFNKRSLGILLGVPAGCPEITKEKIARVNMITESTIKEAGGIVVDLSGLEYETWQPAGSRPKALHAAAELIVEGILDSHSSIQEWRKFHGKN